MIWRYSVVKNVDRTRCIDICKLHAYRRIYIAYAWTTFYHMLPGQCTMVPMQSEQVDD